MTARETMAPTTFSIPPISPVRKATPALSSPAPTLHRLDADVRSLRLLIDAGTADASLDVRIDGHRVWSIRSDARLGVQEFEWPDALRARLGGRARVDVCRSDRTEPIAGADIRFSERPGGPELLDASGQWLSVNKWGDLAVSIDGRAAGFADRLLA